MNPAAQPASKANLSLNDSPDPIDLHVGARLRLRRNLVGMSQEQLGKASDLTFQQIQKYERGINRISASRLYHLSRLLSVPVAWFFDELNGAPAIVRGFAEGGQAPLEDENGSAAHAAADMEAELLQRRETMELIRAYHRITDIKQRRKVLELIKSMSDDTK